MGEITVPDGVWTPIMSLPSRPHEDARKSREAYRPDMGRESLSGSPSSSMICKISLFARLVERAGDDGGARHSGFPSGRRGWVPRLIV